MDLKEDMLSLGTALKEDEKKAYESAYTSCLDLKKQKCLSLNFLVKYDVLVIIKKSFDLAMTT